MVCHCCVPYRGYGIDINVAEQEVTSFNGAEQRYAAEWSVHREHDRFADPVVSFPEREQFMSVDEALDYAQARAHTFVDSMIAADEFWRPLRDEALR